MVGDSRVILFIYLYSLSVAVPRAFVLNPFGRRRQIEPFQATPETLAFVMNENLVRGITPVEINGTSSQQNGYQIRLPVSGLQ